MMNYTEIIEKTYELIDTIKQSEDYKEFLHYAKEAEKDHDLKLLLAEYHRVHDEFEQALKYKDYYPDFEKIRARLQELKLKVVNYPLFKQYKQAEKRLVTYLDEIEYRLKQLVNIKEKHGKIYYDR